MKILLFFLYFFPFANEKITETRILNSSNSQEIYKFIGLSIVNIGCIINAINFERQPSAEIITLSFCPFLGILNLIKKEYLFSSLFFLEWFVLYFAYKEYILKYNN